MIAPLMFSPNNFRHKKENAYVEGIKWIFMTFGWGRLPQTKRKNWFKPPTVARLPGTGKIKDRCLNGFNIP